MSREPARSSISTRTSECLAFFRSSIRSAISSSGSSCSTTRAWSFTPPRSTSPPSARLVRRYRITFLVTTPTFLQMYQRRCTPEQFSSLRVVLTGAEKLPPRLAQAFEDRFGIEPIEGYGVTECAPVVAVNCPDFRAAGYFQPASRRGTVGQPLPGVSVHIVDPDSFAPLPPGHVLACCWSKAPTS